jgi:ABC-type nitrate/sulfonate/bicarbonate transport system substrate-binding protein
MKRRSLIALSALAALALSLAGAACEPGGPRALILADASGPPHEAWVRARAAEFEKQNHRAVRVLRVESGEAAVELAARGEADVALLPPSTPAGSETVSRFVAADHGRVVAEVAVGSGKDRLTVLSVNPKQHPKVDAQGEALATFFGSARD